MQSLALRLVEEIDASSGTMAARASDGESKAGWKAAKLDTTAEDDKVCTDIQVRFFYQTRWQYQRFCLCSTPSASGPQVSQGLTKLRRANRFTDKNERNRDIQFQFREIGDSSR